MTDLFMPGTNKSGANDSVITVQRVSKRFNKRLVLKDVSLEVPAGCVFALLGENGAGKSTLIRGMLGYHKFDSGLIRIAGLDPQRQPMDVRRRVGYVSDAPGLYEWMTVQEAGWYASGFYPSGYMARYAQVCSDFALSPEAQIRSLSKGMRAKTALALAMAFDPDVLVLDEPTSGLDPKSVVSFSKAWSIARATGQTVFLSSHQIHEVERVADWVAILHEGRLQVVAQLEDLKSQVSIVSFSLRDPLLAAPADLDKLEILHRTAEGRSYRLMVRNMNDEVKAALERDANLFELNVIRPNLEELYLGFTQPAIEPDPSSPDRKQVWDVA